MSGPFATGQRVVIRHNPHEHAAENVLGLVVDFQPGAGFMGCDLAYVRYTSPRDGSTQEMPFSTANLAPGNREALVAVAEHHEALAAEARRLAGEVAP